MIEVTSHDELQAILGTPNRAAVAKERTFLSDFDKQWLAASPFCLVATSGVDGTCDVSPKGDPPGFTLVLDDTTIAVPERPGNRRADGFHNILDNPHVGLIYLIPGRGDTLRINGRVRIVRDAPFFEQMVVKGHRPQFALVVDIEQIFYHCSKAFLRSELWSSETWNPTAAPSQAAIAKQTTRREQSLEELEHYYGPEYATRLYTG
ncbi:pyridoxamine 5'-phosphate oxidase family protein [Micromonospora sp. NPDC003197]